MKYIIYVGNLKTITVEADSEEYVKSVILDNAKTFVEDLLDDGVVQIEQKKS
tara:strand:- start:191 stop:346 length:156 start_codon:yes stop_codon:yes gene_type:complete